MAAPAIPLRTESTPDETFAPTAGQTWAITVLKLSLQVLAHRFLFWCVTIGAGVVWTYTVLHPDILRLIAAVAYCATVLWPYLLFEHKRGAS
jgi:hypothetical protein